MFPILNSIFYKVDSFLDNITIFYGKSLDYIHVINIIYVILFTIFGLTIIDYNYLRLLNKFLQILVCFLLMWKYHPFRDHEFKKYDSKLIFSSAVFLFINLSIFEYINKKVGSVINYDIDESKRVYDLIEKIDITDLHI